MRISSLSVLLLVGALMAVLIGGADLVAAQDGLTSGTPVLGVLEGDSVDYSIDIEAGQLLIVSVESDAFDAVAGIEDLAGNELFSDDDGGEGTNSLLVFVAQESGSYIVTVRAWSNGTGDFTLTPTIVDPVIIEVGSTMSLTPPADVPLLYVAFEASAGTVVNISATAQSSDDDLELNLFGTDAQLLDNDDDDGVGTDAYLRRVMLPSDGIYLVKVSSLWEDTSLTGDVDVTVEATEVLYVDATPQSFELSDEGLGTEVYTFDAVNGGVYRITVTVDSGTGVALELHGAAALMVPSFEVNNAVKMSWDYQSDVDGPVQIHVHPSFLSDGDVFTIMLETVE